MISYLYIFKQRVFLLLEFFDSLTKACYPIECNNNVMVLQNIILQNVLAT